MIDCSSDTNVVEGCIKSGIKREDKYSHHSSVEISQPTADLDTCKDCDEEGGLNMSVLSEQAVATTTTGSMSDSSFDDVEMDSLGEDTVGDNDMEEVLPVMHDDPFISERNHIGSGLKKLKRSRCLVDMQNGYNEKDVGGNDASVFKALDFALFLSRLSGALVVTTPIVLLPVIANDLASKLEETSEGVATMPPGRVQGIGPASFAASVTSVAVMGAAVGKFVNGFVCQSLGGRRSSFIYLLGLAISSFLFSVSGSFWGIAVSFAALEFFNSILCTAFASVASNHYYSDGVSFSRAMAAISLGSSAGALLAKVGFAVLLRHVHWRIVARVACGSSLVGACVVHGVVYDSRKSKHDPQGGPLGLAGMKRSTTNVFGSALFWTVGAAHATAFMARSSDKVLGTFFQEVTHLPRKYCGGLTASVTVGFIFGLVTGRRYDTLKTLKERTNFLKKRYAKAAISALVLSFSATGQAAFVLHRWIIALLVLFASGTMSYCISFQWYQLTPRFAQTFGKDKDVCFSLLEFTAYMTCVPIWAWTGRIVATGGVYGWSCAWASFSIWFSIGSVLMLRAVPTFTRLQS